LKKKPQIGILGCGWLGKATAKILIAEGYNVKGSTTSVKGSDTLKTLGIEPYVIELKTELQTENLDQFLLSLNVLVIAIPPRMSENELVLLEALKLMFKNYDFSGIQKLIYVSSTGVFKDDINAVYDEDSKPNNSSERGKYLRALEGLILNQHSMTQAKILRYGGLIKTGGRHPAHYLKDKKNVANPEAPINLIEQSDAANLLCKIIESSSQLKIYHGVNPSHPNRKEYYTTKAKALQINPPEFSIGKVSLGKTILSEKTQADLNFEYKSSI
jgi:nucleoside-diphosphate-sugar epimerase